MKRETIELGKKIIKMIDVLDEQGMKITFHRTSIKNSHKIEGKVLDFISKGHQISITETFKDKIKQQVSYLETLLDQLDDSLLDEVLKDFEEFIQRNTPEPKTKPEPEPEDEEDYDEECYDDEE